MLSQESTNEEGQILPQVRSRRPNLPELLLTKLPPVLVAHKKKARARRSTNDRRASVERGRAAKAAMLAAGLHPKKHRGAPAAGRAARDAAAAAGAGGAAPAVETDEVRLEVAAVVNDGPRGGAVAPMRAAMDCVVGADLWM